MLESDDFLCPTLDLDDVGHPPENSDPDLIYHVVILQIGDTDNYYAILMSELEPKWMKRGRGRIRVKVDLRCGSNDETVWLGSSQSELLM